MGLGIAAPVIVIRLSWRFIYYITSSVAIVAWLFVFVFVPETRWERTPEELAGRKEALYRAGSEDEEEGDDRLARPPLGVAALGPRTWRYDLAIFHGPTTWRRAAASVVQMVKTTVYPGMLWAIVTTSILVGSQGAIGQVASAILIAGGWNFETLGFASIPLVIASPFVWIFGGWVADRISNTHARHNGGRREPEAHLLSLIIPLLTTITGLLVFGYASQNINTLPTIVVLVAIFLVGFGYLTCFTVFSVYLVECYPAFAG